MKKTTKVRWNPIAARLAESNVKQAKIETVPEKNRSSKSRWNPMIARLADTNLKQSTLLNADQDNGNREGKNHPEIRRLMHLSKPDDLDDEKP